MTILGYELLKGRTALGPTGDLNSAPLRHAFRANVPIALASSPYESHDVSFETETRRELV